MSPNITPKDLNISPCIKFTGPLSTWSQFVSNMFPSVRKVVNVNNDVSMNPPIVTSVVSVH